MGLVKCLAAEGFPPDVYARCIDGWEYLMGNRGIATRFNRNGSPRRCATNGRGAAK